MAYRTARESNASHHQAYEAALAVYFEERPEAKTDTLTAFGRVYEMIASAINVDPVWFWKNAATIAPSRSPDSPVAHFPLSPTRKLLEDIRQAAFCRFRRFWSPSANQEVDQRRGGQGEHQRYRTFGRELGYANELTRRSVIDARGRNLRALKSLSAASCVHPA
jgi:hypothetical protein